MRWLMIVGLVAGATARGDARPPVRTPPPQDGNFWRDILEPNADQVRSLLTKAKAVMLGADTALATGEADWAVDQRVRFYTDAYHLLGEARRLAPENLDVLAQLARATDELGKTRETLEVLETAVRVAGTPEKAGPEITGRLGAVHLRLGHRDEAIRWLRIARIGNITITAPAIVTLANALAARGDIGQAIDTLQAALPAQTLGIYVASETTLVAFALAVVYDRDEQRSAAAETIKEMQASLGIQYSTQLATELAKQRFVPAEDQHYYRALFYETTERYIEARAEWALYAATGGPWRARALDHVAAIDALRRQPKPAKPPEPPKAVTP